MAIEYHLEQENAKGKTALTFEQLKRWGITGKLFYQGKRVVIDPFSLWDVYLEADRHPSGEVRFSGYCRLLSQIHKLEECTWVFPAEAAWILQDGVIRAVKDEIPVRFLERARKGPFLLAGKELALFLEDAEGEIPITWKGAQSAPPPIDPMPMLLLVDRHGGFADLWFDYGPYGKVAMHDLTSARWRNLPAEKGWEKDLLETHFLKKRVDTSHYYCPLDKVARSLTFLLEIGWIIMDAAGRRVFRQGRVDLDAGLGQQQITVRAKIHYQEHTLDLQDLVGAFNRQQQFVELSSQAVALIDRDAVAEQWGELAEQEITSAGIVLPRHRCALLEPLAASREELREKIAAWISPDPNKTVSPGPNFRGSLFSYQQEGLSWLKFLEEGKFGGLLADEMGLGKTVQVLAFLSQLKLNKPCLIVVPTSLLFNWQREIEKFVPGLEVYCHAGLKRLDDITSQKLILTSYAQLRLDAPLFSSLSYQLIVLDEAQTIKNPDSQISRVCATLTAEMRLAITGTPIENRFEDLWSIFRFLEPDLLGELQPFRAGIASLQLSAQYLQRVKRKIRPFILRRGKEEVALQLPPKLEQVVFVEMDAEERQIYDRWLQSTQQGLLKKVTLDAEAPHRMEILEAILRLRQLCAHPALLGEAPTSAKFERLLVDLAEVVAEGRKVLVYSQFTTMLQLIAGALSKQGCKYAYLDGSTHDREAVVRQFQEDPETQVFLISLKAGGVGLNLTAADYVFLYDPWWNEALERQAIDRAHRLGKTGTVIARRYIVALSIEEKIMRLKAHKNTLSELLETQEGAFSLNDLLSLLE